MFAKSAPSPMATLDTLGLRHCGGSHPNYRPLVEIHLEPGWRSVSLRVGSHISTLLSRSQRLKIFVVIGSFVLTSVVLILLRSGFTWSGIGSRFTHGGQSRSTKISDYTSDTRRNVNRFTRATEQFLRTRISRAIFLFRVSCVPLILVCHYLHLTLQSMFQNLMFSRWPFSNPTCSQKMPTTSPAICI
jgi:hypothetical protein